MLPKITDDQIKKIILEVRTNGNMANLLPDLPIWMVSKIARKRSISEDDGSELLLAILERIPRIWSLSRPYSEKVVLGFFVTYAFNLYRNLERSNKKCNGKAGFLELWQDRNLEPFSTALHNEKERLDILNTLDFLPIITGVVLCLKFDYPIFNSHRKTLEWRFFNIGRNYADFERIYDKKKEIVLRNLNLSESRVLRYTRLLLDSPEPGKRSWYLKKKKQWMDQRRRTIEKSFFTEREIACILGLTRKQIRSHYLLGIRLLKSYRQDLLHCA